MTEIDDLMDIIRDRTEDDERLARELAAWADGSGRTDGSAIEFDKLIGNPFIGPFGGQSSIRNWGTGQDIAKLADPARVLAEVAAKRQLAAALLREEHQSACVSSIDGWCDCGRDERVRRYLELLAQPYRRQP